MAVGAFSLLALTVSVCRGGRAEKGSQGSGGWCERGRERVDSRCGRLFWDLHRPFDRAGIEMGWGKSQDRSSRRSKSSGQLDGEAMAEKWPPVGTIVASHGNLGD